MKSPLALRVRLPLPVLDVGVKDEREMRAKEHIHQVAKGDEDERGKLNK
jgi:hypothetical protein